MTQRTKIKITEHVMTAIYDNDYQDAELSHINDLEIDLTKWEKFKEEQSFEAGYVETIIENALAGITQQSTGHKYSFDDMLEWYSAIMADEPDSAFNNIFASTVEVG